MGYTHYWKQDQKVSNKKFDCFINDFKKLTVGSQILQREYDNNDPISIGDDFIAFNGIGDDGHETMLYENGGSEFTFCKTARKPYDDYVVASLLLLKNHFTDDIHISSDGNTSEWQKGFDLIKEKLGDDTGFKFKITDNGRLNLWHSSTPKNEVVADYNIEDMLTDYPEDIFEELNNASASPSNLSASLVMLEEIKASALSSKSSINSIVSLPAAMVAVHGYEFYSDSPEFKEALSVAKDAAIITPNSDISFVALESLKDIIANTVRTTSGHEPKI